MDICRAAQDLAEGIEVKITVTLDGEQLFSLEAKEWLLLQPNPGELQLAVNRARHLFSPVTDNPQEDAFYEKAEASVGRRKKGNK